MWGLDLALLLCDRQWELGNASSVLDTAFLYENHGGWIRWWFTSSPLSSTRVSLMARGRSNSHSCTQSSELTVHNLTVSGRKQWMSEGARETPVNWFNKDLINQSVIMATPICALDPWQMNRHVQTQVKLFFSFICFSCCIHEIKTLLRHSHMKETLLHLNLLGNTEFRL